MPKYVKKDVPSKYILNINTPEILTRLIEHFGTNKFTTTDVVELLGVHKSETPAISSKLYGFEKTGYTRSNGTDGLRYVRYLSAKAWHRIGAEPPASLTGKRKKASKELSLSLSV